MCATCKMFVGICLFMLFNTLKLCSVEVQQSRLVRNILIFLKV